MQRPEAALINFFLNGNVLAPVKGPKTNHILFWFVCTVAFKSSKENSLSRSNQTQPTILLKHGSAWPPVPPSAGSIHWQLQPGGILPGRTESLLPVLR